MGCGIGLIYKMLCESCETEEARVGKKTCSSACARALTKAVTDEEGLSPQNRAFVEYLASTAKFDVKKAMEEAGIEGTPAEGRKILKRKVVQKALAKEREKIKKIFYLDEFAVLRGLHAEAINDEKGTSHAARVQAWVWLGKHIGMFVEKEKEKDKSVTYNIVNYSNANHSIEADVKKGLELHKGEIEGVEPVDGITIQDYSDESW